MFPDVKSGIQTFLHCSGGCYREENTGQPPKEMLCFLGAMLAKTKRPECEGSLRNMP